MGGDGGGEGRGKSLQDLLEVGRSRLPPAPPHSRSLGELRRGREERRGEEGGGAEELTEEEMCALLREASLDSETVRSVVELLQGGAGPSSPR